jgi:acetylornithine deacetylase/succinyl-diaminopimelate desuccinylase-like protein
MYRAPACGAVGGEAAGAGGFIIRVGRKNEKRAGAAEQAHALAGEMRGAARLLYSRPGMASALEYASARQAQQWDQLQEFLRIPSVSTLPAHKPDVERAAEWVRSHLAEAGMEHAEVIPTGGHPLVYADWLHVAGAPTILCYGHYDVQPAEPLEEWQSPPFMPVLRDGNIYARGAADDKGQLYAQMQAAEAFLRGEGRVPVNLRFLIEGEEEVGGEGIEAYVRRNAAALGCDAVLITDTTQFAAGLPTLNTGLRGMVYAEVRLRGAEADLHSGLYGGVAPNPLEALARIICGLKDAGGRILIPGFYDALLPPSAAEAADWARLPFDAERYRREEVRAAALSGELEYTPLERVWARPTLEVHGIAGGFTAAGAKTVIPARAAAKISMRLAPAQAPAAMAAAFERRVRELAPAGFTLEVEILHTAEPVLVASENRYLRAAAQALEQTYGRPPVLVRSGGSIPIAALFAQTLDAPVVLMGFATPDCGAHGPNEKLPLANLQQAVATVIHFFAAAAQSA